MIKNAYIHIPFCKSKCKYCVFNSIINFKHIDEYLNALKDQILVEYQGEKLNTLYFGGGTPSLIPPEKIKEIINLFNFEKNAEITIECNPEDNNFYDVNRISLGCQTFNDKLLNLIGRRHNGENIVNTVKNFQNYGIKNINLDFIYGLPLQNEKIFTDDLKRAIDLNVPHVSFYGLKIEEGSYFYKFPPENLPDLDFQADMYLKAMEILENNNYKHYEISNFAKEGFESKHNLNYWNNNYYYGFGCGASGYKKGKRYQNESLIKKFIENPLSKDFEEEITPKKRLEEEIFLGLRKTEGINCKKIKEEYSVDFEKEYSPILNKYETYFRKTPSGFALTVSGMMISNEILQEFI